MTGFGEILNLKSRESQGSREFVKKKIIFLLSLTLSSNLEFPSIMTVGNRPHCYIA